MSNKRDARVRVYSHTDWAFGNLAWLLQYNNIEADFVEPGCSDHSPILLNSVTGQSKLQKPFRVLNVVMQQENVKELVHGIWQQEVSGHTKFRVWKKLGRVAQQSGHIQREYSSIETTLTQYRLRLVEIQEGMSTDLFNQSLFTEERELIQAIEKWENINEKVHRQKSRATWIQYGHKNSKYFFAHLKARQARNRIFTIYKEQGIKLTDPDLIQKEFLHFFRSLLGRAAYTLPCIDICIARDGPCSTLTQQQQLLEPTTSIDVMQALKDLSSDKSLGIDGFNAESFRLHWDIVGEEVTESRLQVFC